MANGRCRIHGGKTPVGAALPQFKHGRYSKYLPARLLDAYQEAMNDPELLELNSSVAVIDARLVELFDNMDSGGSAHLWAEMATAYRAFRLALSAHDDTGMVIAVNKMDSLIRRGADSAAVWTEIRQLLDDRRKHAETQRRLELAGERGVSATEVVTLMSAILNIAQEAIKNIEDRREFVARIQSLAPPGTRQVQ